MKKYLSFFRIRFINGLQYRAAAYAGIATQFAWALIELLMYSAFYRSNPAAIPMEMNQLTSYIWLRQAFLCLFMTWYYDGDILDLVTSGNVAYELCRPVDIYSMWFLKNAATRVSRMVLRCMPILVFSLFLPNNIGLSLPADPLSLVMFLISIVIGSMLSISFTMLIYISTFYTVSSLGVRIVATNIASFLSGELIPLPFLPDSLRTVITILPFASMQNTPFLIYNGVYGHNEALNMMLLQLFWLAIIFGAGKLWISGAVKKVVVQGG
jgi:ABC-type uncharacterized transport system, permease component